MDEYIPQFSIFMHKVEQQPLETNTTAAGTFTIQQSQRNTLRKEGLAALKADLMHWYGGEFDIVETKDGIVIVAENEPNDYTFSWELKSTIKSIDYDPFIEASAFEEDMADKDARRQAREAQKAAHLDQIARKRKEKMEELNKRLAKKNGDANA